MAEKTPTELALERARASAQESTKSITQKSDFVIPDSLDWTAWGLPMTAALLRRIPQRGGRDGDYFLSAEQAVIWAVTSFKLGLDPFLGDTYLVPASNRVNITLQGKLKKARMDGLNLGAPIFQRIPEDPEKPVLGYRCSIPIGQTAQMVEYVAMKKEWEMPGNPNWKNRCEHMLQIRAYEKAVSFAAGIGASENPDDRDLEVTKPDIPTPVVGEFVETIKVGTEK